MLSPYFVKQEQFSYSCVIRPSHSFFYYDYIMHNEIALLGFLLSANTHFNNRRLSAGINSQGVYDTFGKEQF